MAPPVFPARSSGRAERTPIAGFVHWLADAVNHAFGNPREEGAHLPPLVGVQPYRDRPRRRR